MNGAEPGRRGSYVRVTSAIGQSFTSPPTGWTDSRASLTVGAWTDRVHVQVSICSFVVPRLSVDRCALADHPRNLDDEQLKVLARNGGIIQIVTVGGFLRLRSPEHRKAIDDLKEELDEEKIKTEQFMERMKEIDARYSSVSLSDFVDHIDHAVKVTGIEHVGIGSDFDGGGGVSGFNDHSEALNVTIELVRRGYCEEDILKIWGGNFLRVWTEVEKIAQELQKGSENG